MTAVLAVRGLTAAYGSRTALSGVDLDAAPASVTALLGANGAGKTTLLRAVMRSGARIANGSIRLSGEDITSMSATRSARIGIGYVPEGARVFAELTVAENLRLGAFTLLRRKQELARRRERVHELFPILAERAGQRAGTLSGGQRQMLAIGRALMIEPSLLLLDEPFLGLAPVVVESVCAAISEVAARGVCVVVAEQNIRAIEIAHTVHVLRLGELVHTEHSPTRLLHDDRDLLRRLLVA